MIPLDAKVYEVLSLAMRYFFTCLGVMIVWRSFSWLRKDRRQTHKRLKQLPDAGTIGILTVEVDSGDLEVGDILPVPQEGVLGFSRTCDVVVPADDVATAHLDFTFVDGKGLFIYPRRGCEAVVDGALLASRRDGERTPMQHGSVLQVGQAVLRLGVFAGLDVGEAPCHAYIPPMMPEEQVFAPEATAYDDSQLPYPPMQQAGYSPYSPLTPPPYAPGPYRPPEQTSPWQGGDDDAP
ncbi:MAG: hypothetical protein PUC00_07750 [Clostridiales bacterium]|nr:hypothetical protein [Clostridiales bacterium]